MSSKILEYVWSSQLLCITPLFSLDPHQLVAITTITFYV